MHTERKIADGSLDLLFPTLLSVECEGWRFYFYKEFENIFLADKKGELDSEIFSKIFPYLQKSPIDFRWQMVFKSVTFLVGIYYERREIRFYTPKLSQELFLLQQSDILDLDLECITDLRAHTELAASLSVREFPTDIENLVEISKLSDLINDPKFKQVQEQSAVIVKKIVGFLNEYRPSFFEDMTDFGLGLTAQYALLRIHLLKFLAILPSLDHDKRGKEVKRILLEALAHFLKDNRRARYEKKKGQERALPSHYTLALKTLFYLFRLTPAKMLASTIRYMVKLMAKRFIAGETIEGAEKGLRALSLTGRDVTLDQLGESVFSAKEADHYMEEVLKLIRGFHQHVKRGEKNRAGINRAHVSIKVSALASDFRPQAYEYTYGLVAPRLKKILLAAKEEEVFINVDAEHYHYRDIVFQIYRQVLLETPEFKDYENTGIVIQGYLRDAHLHLEEVINLAKIRGLVMPVRLVKGAYWDAETVEADAHSFNAPQFLNKEETDIHFRQLIIKIYEAYPHLKLAIASHNFFDHGFAEAAKELLFPHVGEIEHQCLHMTYEALSTALAKMGWATRNYVPVGSLLVGMAYLVRRIMENSSQVGVLTIMRSHKKLTTLQSPYDIHQEKKSQGKIKRDLSMSKLEDEFFNVAPLRLYLHDERKWMEKALNDFAANSLGIHYRNTFLVNGQMIEINSSSDSKMKVGTIGFANVNDANQALSILEKSFESKKWSELKWSFRTAGLIKAANLMLAKRLELSALIVYEAGKTVPEALADVDEAIDFLNFYARTEAFLQRQNSDLTARGPVVVIAPWNFPLAIPCGMVAAALVAGNSVVLKSAEQTPLIAQRLVELFYAAGVPEDILIHLPGNGETVGDFLIKDQRTSTVVFTGSKAVGTYIQSKTRKRLYKNKMASMSYPVKTITEMGGKNAIIVTQNAELDETVAGILYSAFGHAGQKCSACSRVIVHHAIKDKLIERLKLAAFDLKVGESYKLDTAINPIISSEEKSRLLKQVEEIKSEAQKYGGSVVIDRSKEALPGQCIGPVIVELPYQAAMKNESYAQRELFGPVLHVIGFKKLDQAVALFNVTDYALTGGIFSQSQNDIDYLSAKLQAGNIYINRTITGARVAIEPFGGFKLSGTGPKAGGKHYVYSFHHDAPSHMKQDQFGKDLEAKKAVNNRSFVPTKNNNENPIWAKHVELTRPSLLTPRSRAQRLDKFLELLLASFETHFRGIYQNYKVPLRELRKWANKNYVGFREGRHKNRVIPGQMSFNDYGMNMEHVVLYANQTHAFEAPELKTMIQFLSAVLSGAGVLVVCRESQTFKWWQELCSTLYLAGFSKENVGVSLIDNEGLKNVVNHPKVSAIIFDGAMSDYEFTLGNLFDDGKNDLRVKHVLTREDPILSTDFYRQSLQFIWVRSFAINTMRHGAPLDLDIG